MLCTKEDNIHTITQTKPRDSVAKIEKTLKEATTRATPEEFPEIEKVSSGVSPWEDGYFTETVSRVGEEVARVHTGRQDW
jgi:REP element-mobilizing transposase RayT